MNPNQAHVVYRCFDKDDRLLYIGCTHDFWGRMSVHQSSWQNPASAALNMRMVRHTLVKYPNKAKARKAEREAIYNEAPLFNLHHQKVKRSAAERRAAIESYLQETYVAPNGEFAAELVAIAARFASRTVESTHP